MNKIGERHAGNIASPSAKFTGVRAPGSSPMFSNGLPAILPATHVLICTSRNPGPMLAHRQVRITALN
jgi:hypothetical protein